MNFDELMKQGWQPDARSLLSVEDQLRERLLRAESQIQSLQNEVKQLRRYMPTFRAEQPSPAVIAKRVIRKMVKSKVRMEVYSTHAGLCFYCNTYLFYQRMTIDHMVPLIRGGTNARDNLVCACGPCNTAKGDRMPTVQELDRALFLRKQYRQTPIDTVPIIALPPANVVPIEEDTKTWMEKQGIEIDAAMRRDRERNAIQGMQL